MWGSKSKVEITPFNEDGLMRINEQDGESPES